MHNAVFDAFVQIDKVDLNVRVGVKIELAEVINVAPHETPFDNILNRIGDFMAVQIAINI